MICKAGFLRKYRCGNEINKKKKEKEVERLPFLLIAMMNYVTYSDLFQFGILIVAIISLCRTGR